VRTIAPWVGAVESALLLETRRSLDVVADVERAVNAVMRHRLLTAGSASDAQCVALAARLRIADEDLGTLRTAPFLGLRGTLREPMLGAILAAQSGTAGTLRDQVAVVRAAVGRQSARARIEAALTMVAGASSPSAVQKAIDAANRALVAMPKPDDAAVRAADLAVAGLKMAVRALKEGTIEAAKPWLREAIVPLS
jgi:hypothetical protein